MAWHYVLITSDGGAILRMDVSDLQAPFVDLYYRAYFVGLPDRDPAGGFEAADAGGSRLRVWVYRADMSTAGRLVHVVYKGPSHLDGVDPGHLRPRRWRTLDDGRVELDYGIGPTVPELAGPDASTRRVETWRAPLARHTSAAGVPLFWALAFVYAESGGNPRAISPAGAVGLMQVMPSTARLSRDQLLDPEVNMRVGVGLLGDSRRLGWDLVASASRYNAGMRANGSPHPSVRSPWGLREDPGYIDRVIKAANWWARQGAGVRAPSGGLPPLGFIIALGKALDVF